MAKQIPISLQKIKVKDYNGSDTVKYLVQVSEKGSFWSQSSICDRETLVRFRDEISQLLADSNTAEILKVTEEKGKRIDLANQSDPLCQNCEFKMTFNCVTCLFTLQSPLERKLFVALRKANIAFRSQCAFNWQGQEISLEGKSYFNTQNNFKDVLTIADFYIEQRGLKLCLYTDGHTYHERTEEQAQRDRNIDRKLQELGFQVLRYVGKEVNENIGKIIADITTWTKRAYR